MSAHDSLNHCLFCCSIVIADSTIIDDGAVVRNGIPTRDGWVCWECVEQMIEETDENKQKAEAGW